MVFADIVAFFKAFPALINLIAGLREDIQNLRQDSINRELAEYKAKVNADLKKISEARTNEERLRLASELSKHLSS